MPKCAQNTAGRGPFGNSGGDFAGRTETAEKHSLTIGAVAQMFKVSTLSLRLFELRRMIRRERIGNERVYSWADCERIAVVVKARKAGLATGDLGPMLRAMNVRASVPVTEAGRLKCLALIRSLETQQQAIGNVLGELYRIDWELSDRLGVKDSGGADALADQA